MDNWKNIWNKNDRVNQIILECLIKADGFDGGAGSFSVKDWEKYTQEHFNRLGIRSGDTVFDIGCDCGAFLYPLYLQKHMVGGGGLFYEFD